MIHQYGEREHLHPDDFRKKVLKAVDEAGEQKYGPLVEAVGRYREGCINFGTVGNINDLEDAMFQEYEALTTGAEESPKQPMLSAEGAEKIRGWIKIAKRDRDMARQRHDLKLHAQMGAQIRCYEQIIKELGAEQ